MYYSGAAKARPLATLSRFALKNPALHSKSTASQQHCKASNPQLTRQEVVLQLHHGLCVVLWQVEPGCHWTHVNDRQCHGTTSSNHVQGKDGDVKIIPAKMAVDTS
jgi:hypothetical protein